MPLIMRSDLNELKFESTIKIDYVFAWGGIHFLQADQVVDLLGKLWNAKIKLLLLREREWQNHIQATRVQVRLLIPPTGST